MVKGRYLTERDVLDVRSETASFAEESWEDDDWVSDWRPPGLNALMLLAMASELGSESRKKTN